MADVKFIDVFDKSETGSFLRRVSGRERSFTLPRLDYSRRERIQYFVKRIVDFTVSLFTLALISPLLLIICVAIKIDSPGPIIFSQARWGIDGKKIKVYKFRSMKTDLCDASGVSQTTSNDRRVTRVGAVLRRSNLDELPQLLCIIKGDMSIVGPRCHPIGMIAAGREYEKLCPDYHVRHLVKPGLTGLAQSRGLRGPTVRPSKARARIACDIYYVRNFSLWLDLKIIIVTFINEIRGGSGS